jgi:hypothetical protein|tara:strand:- start:1647 stop:1913 length:267 start_codon:yes stop_codon:yes gene_type:complete
MIKILMLKEYSLVLIARIEEVSTELGEPDCKLIEPYELKGDYLEHWPSFSMQREMMIHSDSILTILEPDKTHLDKYQALTAKNVTKES